MNKNIDWKKNSLLAVATLVDIAGTLALCWIIEDQGHGKLIPSGAFMIGLGLIVALALAFDVARRGASAQRQFEKTVVAAVLTMIGIGSGLVIVGAFLEGKIPIIGLQPIVALIPIVSFAGGNVVFSKKFP